MIQTDVILLGLLSKHGVREGVREWLRVFPSLSAMDGGEGSGNFEHEGRPGKIGGSSKSGGNEEGTSEVKENKDWEPSIRHALQNFTPELLGAVTYALTGKPVLSITGQEFQKDGVKLTDKIPAYYKAKYNGKATNPDIGEVQLDLEGVKDDLGHGIGALKAAAFMCVPAVIKNGVVFDKQKNWKNRGYDTYVLVAPVLINGERYIEEVVVKSQTNRQGLYLHEVELQKRLEDAFKTPTQGSASPTSRLIIGKKIEKFNT